ncbi:TPA: H-NS histone family protein, partial [Mannheimia haemolytica]|nr:H-NS histone family protein [Mannheimia haemolytica]
RKARKALSPRPAKYKFVDANGNEKTWTGQGRTPKALQDALDSGKKLEDFAI